MTQFETTRWGIIRRAKLPEIEACRDAYTHLCSTYWRPLYAFARLKGLSPEDARDLTQDFLAGMWERRALQQADATRGRFRTFLLTAMENRIKDEWKRRSTLKRHPDGVVISIDARDAEGRYLEAAFQGLTPEELYEQEWVTALLETALNSLRAEFVASGKSEQFEALAPYLTYDGDAVPYAEVSDRLGVSVSAVTTAVHRLRERYFSEIRKHVADTVDSEEEYQDEVRYLLAIFSKPTESVL